MSKIYIAKEVKANYASSSYPDSGASKATTCIVNGSNTYQYRSFLQHDFSGIPCGSKIISAKLYVYASEGNDNTAQGGHKFDAVISEWEEGSNTWNNQASVANTPIPADWLVPTIGEWNNWDITELVQKWIYQVMPNNGLMFVNKDETGYRHNWKFYNRRQSEEYATYVEVEYEPIEQWCISHERMVELADAIRGKTGKTDSLTVEQMVTELEAQKAILELPAIPIDSTINKYKYLMVIRYNNPVGEADYYLHASINKPYKYDGEQVLNTTAYIKIPSGGRCSYLCSSGETEWSLHAELTAELNLNQYNFTIIWSNCDIPDGSAAATEIYFKASPLIV